MSTKETAQNTQFAIGQTYPQDGASLRILAFHENRVLLEKSRDDEVYQYVVTSSLCIYDDELHWSGSGQYFTPCISGCTPFEELSKAIEFMNGPRKVYILVADTDCGSSANVKTSMREAKAMLQFSLDHNDAIKEAAQELGITQLSADEYLNDEIRAALDVSDLYTIEEQELDFLTGGAT